MDATGQGRSGGLLAPGPAFENAPAPGQPVRGMKKNLSRKTSFRAGTHPAAAVENNSPALKKLMSMTSVVSNDTDMNERELDRLDTSSLVLGNGLGTQTSSKGKQRASRGLLLTMIDSSEPKNAVLNAAKNFVFPIAVIVLTALQLLVFALSSSFRLYRSNGGQATDFQITLNEVVRAAVIGDVTRVILSSRGPFWFVVVLELALILLMAYNILYFVNGHPRPPSVAVRITHGMSILLGTLLYVVILRVLLTGFTCGGVNESDCWSGLHWLQLAFAIPTVLYHIAMSAVIVLNAYPADLNSKHIFRAWNPRLSFLWFCTVTIVTVAHVSLADSYPAAFLWCMTVLMYLVGVLGLLLQPYYLPWMNKLRVATWMSLGSASVIGYIVAHSLKYNQSVLLGFTTTIPLVPIFGAAYLIVRPRFKSDWLDRKLALVLSLIENGDDSEDLYRLGLSRTIQSASRAALYASYLTVIRKDFDAAEFYYQLSMKVGRHGSHNEDYAFWCSHHSYNEKPWTETYALFEHMLHLQDQGTGNVFSLTCEYPLRHALGSLLFMMRRGIRREGRFLFNLVSHHRDTTGVNLTVAGQILWQLIHGPLFPSDRIDFDSRWAKNRFRKWVRRYSHLWGDEDFVSQALEILYTNRFTPQALQTSVGDLAPSRHTLDVQEQAVISALISVFRHLLERDKKRIVVMVPAQLRTTMSYNIMGELSRLVLTTSLCLVFVQQPKHEKFDVARFAGTADHIRGARFPRDLATKRFWHVHVEGTDESDGKVQSAPDVSGRAVNVSPLVLKCANDSMEHLRTYSSCVMCVARYFEATAKVRTLHARPANPSSVLFHEFGPLSTIDIDDENFSSDEESSSRERTGSTYQALAFSDLEDPEFGAMVPEEYKEIPKPNAFRQCVIGHLCDRTWFILLAAAICGRSGPRAALAQVFVLADLGTEKEFDELYHSILTSTCPPLCELSHTSVPWWAFKSMTLYQGLLSQASEHTDTDKMHKLFVKAYQLLSSSWTLHTGVRELGHLREVALSCALGSDDRAESSRAYVSKMLGICHRLAERGSYGQVYSLTSVALEAIMAFETVKKGTVAQLRSQAFSASNSSLYAESILFPKEWKFTFLLLKAEAASATGSDTAVQCFEAAMNLGLEGSATLVGRLRGSYSFLLSSTGQYDTAADFAYEGVLLLQDKEPTVELVMCMRQYARALRLLDRLQESQTWYSRALNVARHNSFYSDEAKSLTGLAVVLRKRGLLQAAVGTFSQAMHLLKWTGNRSFYNDALHGMAVAQIMTGNFHRARVSLQRLMTSYLEQQDQLGAAFAALTLLDTALLQGNDNLADITIRSLKDYAAIVAIRPQLHIRLAVCLILGNLSAAPPWRRRFSIQDLIDTIKTIPDDDSSQYLSPDTERRIFTQVEHGVPSALQPRRGSVAPSGTRKALHRTSMAPEPITALSFAERSPGLQRSSTGFPVPPSSSRLDEDMESVMGQPIITHDGLLGSPTSKHFATSTPELGRRTTVGNVQQLTSIVAVRQDAWRQEDWSDSTLETKYPESYTLINELVDLIGPEDTLVVVQEGLSVSESVLTVKETSPKHGKPGSNLQVASVHFAYRLIEKTVRGHIQPLSEKASPNSRVRRTATHTRLPGTDAVVKKQSAKTHSVDLPPLMRRNVSTLSPAGSRAQSTTDLLSHAHSGSGSSSLSKSAGMETVQAHAPAALVEAELLDLLAIEAEAETTKSETPKSTSPANSSPVPVESRSSADPLLMV